ncbi:MAG: EamA family transporter [Phycisphaerales bacterium]|nr:EamA family transporter [Phycisphaerales bacterium]
MPWLNSVSWWVFAIAGAVFAGATNVFIKAGMGGVNSDLATAARTTLAVPIVWLIAIFAAPKLSEIAHWSARNWLFITFSALASGLSWLCMYKSISLAGITKTLPIDKSSIAFGVILAVIFLRERPNWQYIVATLLVLTALAVTLIPEKKADVSPTLTTQTQNHK